jgi:hypothetical protein
MHLVRTELGTFLDRTTSVGTEIVSRVMFPPSPICLECVSDRIFPCKKYLYPNSFAPQPSTLPESVNTKLLRLPVAIWETLTPLREGISKRESENLMCWSSIPSKLLDVASGANGSEAREKGEAFVNGSATALGTSSTGTREGDEIELGGAGISNFHRPS